MRGHLDRPDWAKSKSDFFFRTPITGQRKTKPSDLPEIDFIRIRPGIKGKTFAGNKEKGTFVQKLLRRAGCFLPSKIRAHGVLGE
jgi:hypothetical protein